MLFVAHSALITKVLLCKFLQYISSYFFLAFVIFFSIFNAVVLLLLFASRKCINFSVLLLPSASKRVMSKLSVEGLGLVCSVSIVILEYSGHPWQQFPWIQSYPLMANNWKDGHLKSIS